MGVQWPSASRSYLMIGDVPRLGSNHLSFTLLTAAENLALQDDLAGLGDQFTFGEVRGTKREGEGDGSGTMLFGAMFGDEAYDELFWNQIANSTELPWSVVYPDESQERFL
jgi:hypothetical protein